MKQLIIKNSALYLANIAFICESIIRTSESLFEKTKGLESCVIVNVEVGYLAMSIATEAAKISQFVSNKKDRNKKKETENQFKIRMCRQEVISELLSGFDFSTFSDCQVRHSFAHIDEYLDGMISNFIDGSGARNVCMGISVGSHDILNLAFPVERGLDHVGCYFVKERKLINSGNSIDIDNIYKSAISLKELIKSRCNCDGVSGIIMSMAKQ